MAAMSILELLFDFDLAFTYKNVEKNIKECSTGRNIRVECIEHRVMQITTILNSEEYKSAQIDTLKKEAWNALRLWLIQILNANPTLRPNRVLTFLVFTAVVKSINENSIYLYENRKQLQGLYEETPSAVSVFLAKSDDSNQTCELLNEFKGSYSDLLKEANLNEVGELITVVTQIYEPWNNMCAHKRGSTNCNDDARVRVRKLETISGANDTETGNNRYRNLSNAQNLFARTNATYSSSFNDKAQTLKAERVALGAEDVGQLDLSKISQVNRKIIV